MTDQSSSLVRAPALRSSALSLANSCSSLILGRGLRPVAQGHCWALDRLLEPHCRKRASERMTMMIEGPIRIKRTGGTVKAMVPSASLTGILLAFSSARSSRF